MLRVSLIGNLGSDPDQKYSQKGALISSFRVAVNQTRTRPDSDERIEQTEWFRVRASGRLGEFVAARLRKGFGVLVVGRLEIGHFQDKEGRDRTGFDVWADDVQLLRGGRGEQLGEENVLPEQQGETVAVGATPRTIPSGSPELEDLPF